MKNYRIEDDELKAELYCAEIERSLDAIAYSWENDVDLHICEMTNHLEEMCNVVEGKIDYNEFIAKVDIKDVKNS